jgi:hypothetical protein
MLGAFAMAVRSGQFSGECYGALAEGTVRGTISHVVQAFWAKGRQNPTKDKDHELGILLSRQFQAFQNEHPKQAQQKALSFSVLDELAKQQVTELDKAIIQITIGAAFFACHSCEYLKVPRREMKPTILLCLQNIGFFMDGQLIWAPSDNLELVDSIVMTFKMQKNKQKHKTVIHRRTEDATLCPVLQWSHFVNQIWAHPGTMEDTPVGAVWHNRLEQIFSHETLAALQVACATIGSA